MKNKKGFMMAEAIVVLAIALTFLVSIFLSYNKILGMYKTRISYYDAVTLFRLGYFRDVLIGGNYINEALTNAKDNKVINVYNSNGDGILNLSQENNNIKEQVFLVYNHKDSIEKDILSSVDVRFKDYVDFLSTSVNLDNTNYVLIMERCNTLDGKTDDCRYAYLEVKDGYEYQ